LGLHLELVALRTRRHGGPGDKGGNTQGGREPRTERHGLPRMWETTGGTHEPAGLMSGLVLPKTATSSTSSLVTRSSFHPRFRMSLCQTLSLSHSAALARKTRRSATCSQV